VPMVGARGFRSTSTRRVLVCDEGPGENRLTASVVAQDRVVRRASAERPLQGVALSASAGVMGPSTRQWGELRRCRGAGLLATTEFCPERQPEEPKRTNPIASPAGCLRRRRQDCPARHWRSQGHSAPDLCHDGIRRNRRNPIRRSFGFRTYRCIELALFHTLGDLPQPTFTHKFF
jgi:hypothetical protein